MHDLNPDMAQLFADRQAQRSALHTRHLNEQFVRVLKTIGYDVGFQKGQGQYLFDRDGARYLDLRCTERQDMPWVPFEHKVNMVLPLPRDPGTLWKKLPAGANAPLPG